MDIERDWDALSSDWKGQAVPDLDVDRIRAEVMRRGRTLRRVVVAEVALTLGVLVACAFIALSPGADRFEVLLFGALGVFLVTYQAGMVWLRRRQLADGGLDAPSLVELEVRRSRTVLHYWRIGLWTCLAIWLGYFALVMIGLGVDWPAPRMGGLVGSLLANAFVIPAMSVYGWWRCRSARARLGRFQSLGRKLRSA